MKRRLPPIDFRYALVGAVVLFLVVLWAGQDAYRDSLTITGYTYALVALGMFVPFVLAGSLSMAFSAYAAIGAYAVALIGADSHWPLWVGWLVGPPIAAVVAVVLGLATRRLSGFFLGAVTLLFAEAFSQFSGTVSWTGGAVGILTLPTLAIGGWQPTELQQVVAGAILIAVIALALDRLRLSRWGILARTAREAPIVVETNGVSVASLELIALGVGAGIASLGGALFTSNLGGANPGTFDIDFVFLALFMPIIGGVNTAWGAVLGAGIIVDLTLNVSVLSSSGLLLVALGVLIILMIFPRGILGAVESLGDLPGQLRRRQSRGAAEEVGS